MKRVGYLVLMVAFLLMFAACAEDDKVNTGTLDSSTSGLDSSSSGDEQTQDQIISKIPDGTSEDTTAPEDTNVSIEPDVVPDSGSETPDVEGNPKVTDVEGPNLTPPPSGDPIAKACVGLIEKFCTKIITKCNNVPLIGDFVSNPEVIQQCVNIVQSADAGIGQVCDTIAEQAENAIGGNLGLLKNFAPTIVNVCIGGFECTTETLTGIGSKIAGLLGGLGGGSTPDLSGILDIALDLCGPTLSGLIP